MPIYTPTFKIRIAGVEYTNEVLSNATITAGRNDFFEPTQPSYCNLELINLSGTSPAINLLDVVNIQVKDTNNVFVDLFTGEVSSVQNTLEGAGANDQYANTVQVQAIGFLGLLVKRYAGAVSYPQEFDGQRIERILEETLYTAWEDLSNSFNSFSLGSIGLGLSAKAAVNPIIAIIAKIVFNLFAFIS